MSTHTHRGLHSSWEKEQIRTMFNLSEISAAHKKSQLGGGLYYFAEKGVGILDSNAKKGGLSQVQEERPEDSMSLARKLTGGPVLRKKTACAKVLRQNGALGGQRTIQGTSKLE